MYEQYVLKIKICINIYNLYRILKIQSNVNYLILASSVNQVLHYECGPGS